MPVRPEENPSGGGLLSCLPSTPFVTLGEPNASVIDYNLPVSSTLDTQCMIPLKIARENFNPTFVTKPVPNVWETI